MAPRLVVRQGDITTYDGDAVVNAANNHLILGAGVAGAIRSRGGPSIQEECDRHGPIAVGEAAITGAGDLAARYVIHAAAMGDEPVSERSIRESTAAAVDLAVANGVRRLAFPVLGAGVGGFELRASAKIMIEAIRTSPQADALAEVVFFRFTPEDVVALEAVVA